MNYRLGLDIGIASVGWAVVDEDKNVIDAGARLFESADASKNEARRNHRGTRRLTRRKVHRLERFNRLWKAHGLACDVVEEKSPLDLRVRALTEAATTDELYLILKNMLKHRGISYLDDAVDEQATGAYKEALNRNAEMLKDLLPCQIQKKRLEQFKVYRGNNVVQTEKEEQIALNNVFTKSAYVQELHQIFDFQRTYHSFISEEFIEAYMDIYESKRAYYDGPGNELSRTDYGRYTTEINEESGEYITADNLFEKLIGKCSVYQEELRASAMSYTAQEFNLLNDLNNLTVNGDKLTETQKRNIVQDVLSEKVISINAKRFRKYIEKAIGDSIDMMTGARVDAKDNEIFHTFEGYRKLRKELDFEDGVFDRGTLDELAHILTINTDKESILNALSNATLNMDEAFVQNLIIFRKKNGSYFSKWHAFSLKIMQELIQQMYAEPKNQMEILTERGVFKTSSDIYKEHNYLPANLILKDIFNPVVKRSVNQSVKILNAVIKKYGYPMDIIIEMARDKNEQEQKKRIRQNQGKNEKELKLITDKIMSEYGIEIVDRHYHMHKALKTKLRLWHEQQGKCLYSGRPIRIDELLENPNLFEIDHIIPISISFDDSRSNKVLVFTYSNQLKGNRTPYMYLSGCTDDWNFEKFSFQVNELYQQGSISRNKRNNLLFRENITKVEVVKGFISRNLNDTRYASRVVLNTVQGYMKAHETGTKVKVVRGSFTSQLRNKLHLAKDRDESYSHHAVDAMVMCYSQMGLDAYRIAQKDIIDYESGEILDENAYNKMSDEELYERKMFYEGIKDIQQTILEAEKRVKFSHKVDKKVNRQLSNETIYGVREKADGTRQKISKIKDIYDLNSFETFGKKMKKNKKGIDKLDEFLMYHHDPKTFEFLLKVVERYKDKPNPFLAYKEEHGEPIRKYSKKGNGPFVKSLKYYDGEVGSCIDISHKYGHDRGSRKVVLDSLNPYRTDVYYRESDDSYHLAGIKYANFKFDKGTYVLDEDSYSKVLVSEKILEEGEGLEKLEEKGFEFIFSLYKNDLILYEKNGEKKIERYLSRTKPRDKNYIETKPINASKFAKQNLVGLGKTKKIVKINTDVLGNRHYTHKEKFCMSFKLDN